MPALSQMWDIDNAEGVYVCVCVSFFLCACVCFCLKVVLFASAQICHLRGRKSYKEEQLLQLSNFLVTPKS